MGKIMMNGVNYSVAGEGGGVTQEYIEANYQKKPHVVFEGCLEPNREIDESSIEELATEREDIGGMGKVRFWNIRVTGVRNIGLSVESLRPYVYEFVIGINLTNQGLYPMTSQQEKDGVTCSLEEEAIGHYISVKSDSFNYILKVEIL